ncbi:hypothetical protein EPN28_02350 [Patescibacteria group bacterium]|nr:MAG: hypothetical protein EPN28_02350 [Patescibacteria group bacterium]
MTQRESSLFGYNDEERKVISQLLAAGVLNRLDGHGFEPGKAYITCGCGRFNQEADERVLSLAGRGRRDPLNGMANVSFVGAHLAVFPFSPLNDDRPYYTVIEVTLRTFMNTEGNNYLTIVGHHATCRGCEKYKLKLIQCLDLMVKGKLNIKKRLAIGKTKVLLIFGLYDHDSGYHSFLRLRAKGWVQWRKTHPEIEVWPQGKEPDPGLLESSDAA